MLAHPTLVYVRWAKATLTKDGGNFSCLRLCNICLVHTLLGPRDNLFSEDFHLLECQKLVRLAEYLRFQNQDAKKNTTYPLPRLQDFFRSTHKLHVGEAFAKTKYDSPSINVFIISSASVLIKFVTCAESLHSTAGISH